MKRSNKFILIFAVILSLLAAVTLTGCGSDAEVPAVEIVSLAAADGTSTGEAGAAHLLKFTAPEGSKTAVSVQKDGVHAELSDCYSTAVDSRTQQLVFYNAGEYAVTVYATKGGMQGSATSTVKVVKHAVSVSDVELKLSAGETANMVDSIYRLSYNATENAEITVTVAKGEQAAAASDYSYDSVYKTITFRKAGEYTVTVTASIGSATDSGSATVSIAAHNSPTVTVSASAKKVEEDEPVLIKRTVIYKSGDKALSEDYKVTFRPGTTGSYKTPADGSYSIVGDTFIPHLAGRWRVTVVATGECGSEGSGRVDVECTAKTMELSCDESAPDSYRIKTGTPLNIKYNVSGAYDKYDVTFDTNGKTGLTVVAGNGMITVTASKVDSYNLTVTYTHKTITSIKHTLIFEINAVASLLRAPVFGEDPFDGMPDEMLTSMGYLVYCDATFVGNGRKATGSDIECEITYDTLASDNSSAQAEIMYAAGDRAYPYIMPRNFDDNTASGEFTVRMTVTDPVTKYSVVAEKTFTVVPTGNDETEAAAKLQEHIEKYPDFFKMGPLNYSNAVGDCRQNMVLTKTGTIMQRSNPWWPLQHGAGNENADFAYIDVDMASCRLEFKFTLLGANPDSGNVCLGLGFCPTSNSGLAGYVNLQSVTESGASKLDLQNGLNNKGTAVAADSDLVKPTADAGTTMYVRIDREVSGDKVTYTFYAATEKNGVYKSYGGATFNSSATADDPGAAKMNGYRFTHRNAGGCYAVEDVKVTSL